MSPCGPTYCVELIEGKLEEYTLTPEDFGIKPCRYQDVATRSDARGNARAALAVLAGRDQGPLADFLAMNTAVVLKLTGKARDLPAGVDRARQAVAQGKALDKLRELVSLQTRDPGRGLATLEGLLKELD